MVYSKCAKALLSLLLLATNLNSCSQGANLNGSSGGSLGGAGKGSGGQGGDEDGPGGKNGGKGQLDANGALKETLKDGRIRLTYKGENQGSISPVDIVFIVDTSGSMGEERQALEKNLNGFLGQIATTVAKIDYHAWIIASPFLPAGTVDTKLVEVVSRRVQSTDALTQLNNFVMGTMTPAPLTQLRDNSQKQFIIVTDDDARGTVATNIVQLVTSTPKLMGKTSVSGVIGLTKGKVSAQCSIANVGTQYQELAANPATKGTILDLCSDDWSKLLTALAQKIISDTRKSAFDLSDPLDATKTIEVSVNGATVPNGGYTIDAASSKIVLSTAYAPAPGQELVITYSPLK